jgi:hypothetical protein
MFFIILIKKHFFFLINLILNLFRIDDRVIRVDLDAQKREGL